MSNQNLLSQSYNQIRKGIMGDGAANFQMLAKPMNFSWPVPGPGQMSGTAYQLIKMMPKWSDVASYDPGDATFFDSYRSLLSHITFKVSPEKQNDLNNLKDQWNNALKDVATASANANTAYETAKQNGGAIFAAQYADINAWMAGAGGKPFINAINAASEIATRLGDDYTDKTSQLLTGNDRLKKALAAIKVPDGLPGSGSSPRGWTKVTNTAGDLVWQPSFDIGTSGQEWRAKLSGGSQGGFTVSLDASQAKSDYQKSWAGGSASYGNLFWGASGGGGWEKMDISDSGCMVRWWIYERSGGQCRRV